MDREQLTSEKLVSILESVDLGIYILDAEGRYIYANNGLVRMHSYPKEKFAETSVYDQKTTVFDICISDIVFREKRQVSMFQDVNNRRLSKKIRQLVTSTPILDDWGNVKYIVALVEPVPRLAQRFQAAQQSRVSIFNVNLDQPGERSVVAESTEMREIMNWVNHVANADANVMITGETGVGKEVVAHQIHKRGNRRDKPFIEVNCAALPEDLLEAELFGYVKGAFTGALNTGKSGLVQAADGGTLFLDEINSLPLRLQGKLLHLIEDKKLRPVGSSQEQIVDFRLITATNQSLLELCEKKLFRQDLYYRLNVIPMRIPPLRQRRQDILPLADMFLHEFCKKYEKHKSLSQMSMEQLLGYNWPGNVRELRNLVERLVVTSAEDVIEIKQIPSSFFEAENPPGKPRKSGDVIVLGKKDMPALISKEDFSLQQYIDGCEEELLATLLDTVGSTQKAAKLLKISRATMARKRQKYGL